MNSLQHIGIIMDGNGRWAKAQGLPRIEGHKRGLDVAQNVIEQAVKRGVKVLSLYVFSTENWKRPQAEIDGLFALAEKFFDKFEKFCQDKIKVVVSGERDGLPKRLLNKIDKITAKTVNFDTICVNLCINYGGQTDVVNAVNKVVQSGKPVTVQSLCDNLYNALPAPDLIIRTGGQKRLSNFLLFTSAYAELYFCDTLWPDFSPSEFDKIIDEYNGRVRNFGGI